MKSKIIPSIHRQLEWDPCVPVVFPLSERKEREEREEKERGKRFRGEREREKGENGSMLSTLSYLSFWCGRQDWCHITQSHQRATNTQINTGRIETTPPTCRRWLIVQRTRYITSPKKSCPVSTTTSLTYRLQGLVRLYVRSIHIFLLDSKMTQWQQARRHGHSSD